MAVTSNRSITVGYSGGLVGSQVINAADNASSPAQIQIVTLSIGDNQITVPTAGTVPTAVTIVPPTGNGNGITLKGNASDVGIFLHVTDPTSIALDSAQTSFYLKVAGAPVTGVRLLWT